MTTPAWFDDLTVLGNLPPEAAATKSREVGGNEAASALEAAQEESFTAKMFGERKWWWPFQDKAWQHTAHAFGYLAPPGSDPLPIQYAGNIPTDATLKNGRIKIALDRLRVADYPGGGTHRVLFDLMLEKIL